MSATEVWLLQQAEADLPADDKWLSPWEADRVASFRIPKRRNDWRLGRWTAKRAVSVYLAIPQDAISLAKIEVKPAASGAPEVFISSTAPRLTISLSHRGGVAICAVASAEVQLGCDLELIEPHSEAFVRDYFTSEEQAIVDAADEEQRQALVALIWSSKESALKALGTGLREPAQSVSVCRMDHLSANDCWTEVSVRIPSGRQLSGWCRRSEKLLRTIIAEPKAKIPITLASVCGTISLVDQTCASQPNPEEPGDEGLLAAII